LLLQVLSGHDARDPISLRGPVPDFVGGLGEGVKGLRIGYGVEFGFAVADPDVDASIRDAVAVFDGLGANVEEAPLRFDPQPAEFFYPVWAANGIAMYGHLVDAHLEDLMPYTVKLSYVGAQISGGEYATALRHADGLRSNLADYFESFDLLLLPTTYVTAYKHQTPPETVGGKPVLRSKQGHPYGVAPLTMAFNISWNPAASVPCGFDRDGLPIGLQIVGHLGDDATVLRAAAAFEEAKPWADKLPPVS
jgi:aspartyl-tRNA(Asn)/glutamyl-tRNA(Gln) amidotransferase subunit A